MTLSYLESRLTLRKIAWFVIRNQFADAHPAQRARTTLAHALTAVADRLDPPARKPSTAADVHVHATTIDPRQVAAALARQQKRAMAYTQR